MELCPTFSFSFASGASVSMYVKWVEYLRGLALGVVLCGYHHAVEGVTWGSVTLGRLLPAFIPGPTCSFRGQRRMATSAGSYVGRLYECSEPWTKSWGLGAHRVWVHTETCALVSCSAQPASWYSKRNLLPVNSFLLLLWDRPACPLVPAACVLPLRDSFGDIMGSQGSDVPGSGWPLEGSLGNM